MGSYVHRGRLAQKEHDRKLREYIEKHLDDLIQRQKLVQDGKVMTDLSVLDLPRLRYSRDDDEQLGRGEGKGGQASNDKGEGARGKQGRGEGDEIENVDLSGRQGADIHGDATTVAVDFEEFVRLAQKQLLDELKLPTFRPPSMSGELEEKAEDEDMDIDRPGLPADLHLERTMIESLQRNLRERGVLEYDVDIRRDGWYFVDLPESTKSNRALEVYLLDISGSVSGHNIALIRKFIFIVWYYLDKQYAHNARRYIVFQDEAEEVDRDRFFSIESRGGTHISAGFEKALEALEGYSNYDKFLFFFSDGDNSTSDDEKAVELLDEVLERFDHVCYGRINPCDNPLSNFNKTMKEKVEHSDKLTFTDIKDLENVRETIVDFMRDLLEKAAAGPRR